jgi:hypothetical protein
VQYESYRPTKERSEAFPYSDYPTAGDTIQGVRFFADIPLVFWRHLTNIVVGGYIQLIFELGLRYRMFYDLN